MKKHLIFLISICILVLGACTPASPDSGVGGEPASPTAESTPEPGLTPTIGNDLPNEPSALDNTQWQLVSFALPGPEAPETPVIAGTTLTLILQEGGLATGSGGCNSFGAQYEVSDSQLTISELVTTEKACIEQPIMEQEQQYYAALQAANAYELTENELKIWHSENLGVLNFVKVTDSTPSASPTLPMDLTHTQWTLQSFGPAGAEVPVVEGSTITLEFLEGAQAGGSGGCNQFGALYHIQQNTIVFEGLTSTLRACSDEQITQQEQQYFQALQNTVEFELLGDQLFILYDGGSSKLNFIRAETAQTSGEDVQIHWIQMLDAQNGWAVGGMTSENTSLILQTTDGGLTWADRTPPEAPQQATGPVQNPPTAFFRGFNGWAVYPFQMGETEPDGFIVWSTKDGGTTWTPSKTLELGDIPMDYFIPSDLAFLTDEFGWMVAHLGVGMNHDYFAIFTTQDGGQTWQQTVNPNTHAELQGCTKSGLVFTSPTDGWLSGNCPGLMPNLFFYQTTDGGATWAPVPLPAEESLGLEDYNAMGNRCGISQLTGQETATIRFLLSCYGEEQNTFQSYLGISTDQGKSWQYAPLPVANATFHFISEKEGWLAGSEELDPQAAKTVFHTLDGGQSWESLNQALQGDQIEFVDSQNGWIVSRTSETKFLMYSTDGGSTWKEIQPVLVI